MARRSFAFALVGLLAVCSCNATHLTLFEYRKCEHKNSRELTLFQLGSNDHEDKPDDLESDPRWKSLNE